MVHTQLVVSRAHPFDVGPADFIDQRPVVTVSLVISWPVSQPCTPHHVRLTASLAHYPYSLPLPSAPPVLLSFLHPTSSIIKHAPSPSLSHHGLAHAQQSTRTSAGCPTDSTSNGLPPSSPSWHPSSPSQSTSSISTVNGSGCGVRSRVSWRRRKRGRRVGVGRMAMREVVGVVEVFWLVKSGSEWALGNLAGIVCICWNVNHEPDRRRSGVSEYNTSTSEG